MANILNLIGGGYFSFSDITLQDGESWIWPEVTVPLDMENYHHSVYSRGAGDSLAITKALAIRWDYGEGITADIATTMVLGGEYSITISRTGLNLDIDIVDTTTLQSVGSTSASFVTQAPRMNRCFASSSGTSGWNEKIGGVIQLGSAMSLDMNQLAGTTTIPDGIGSNDATITGPAVFEPEGGAALPDITFTNFADNAWATITDMGNGDAVFTVSGTIENGATVSAIEWKRGAGAWQNLITSPANSWTSPAITINDVDSITFRSTDEPATEYEFLNISSAVVISARGQSGINGRGAIVQPTLASAKQAFMFNSIDEPVAYLSPHGTPDDPAAAGSYIDNIVQKVTESGFHVAVITGSQGATSIAAHVKGQTIYTNFLRRVDTTLSGTVSLNIWDQGNADYDGVLTGREAMLNQFVNDLKADTGGKTYIVDINLTGADALRAINASVIASNPDAEYGGSMVGIFAGGDDQVHAATAQELSDVADEVYQYLNIGIFSSLNINFTTVPDGTYTVILDSEDGTRLSRADRAIAGNVFTSPPLLGIASGSRIKGYLDDTLTSSVDGVYIEGVTS